MQVTQTLRRMVQINKHGTALIFGERRWTYEEMQERVMKLAGALQKLGLSEGDRVAMLALTSDRYVEFFYGVPWAGGMVVPLNIRLAPPELIYLLNDSASRLLIVDDTFAAILPTLVGNMETVEHVIFAGEGGTPEGALHYEALIAEAEPVPDAGRGGDDTLGIFYTGGTTGLPKGVMTTHDNVMHELQITGRLVPKDTPLVWLTATPLFHVTGSIPVYGAVGWNGTHVLLPGFDPEDTMRAVQDHRANFTVWVPTMVNTIVNHPAVEAYDLSSLGTIIYGASPMPLAVASKAMEVLPQCEFIHVYGMTETTGAVTLLASKYHVLDGPLSKIKSVGRSVFGSDVKVVDENDKEIARGEIGEIVMAGPLIAKGYWNKPEATEQALRGGWMHSGDLGYMDDEGFVYVVDRLKDMIITGGENVYSVEVENAISQHPAVAMCAVIGIPNDQWGEAIHAEIVLKDELRITEEEIIAHCREHIAGYKCPRSVTFRDDPLPLTGAGKVLKHVLRAPYWEGHEKRVN